MKTINFTIAVMIYNIEKFLPMCLESIISQEGDDIEILLIDDGSSDSSGHICDQYAKKDSRIRVIHQANAGVAAARNVAIRNACGKWLVQVDGDDVLLENAISNGRVYLDDDSDWLQFDAIDFVDEVSLLNWKPKSKEIIVSGELIKEYHMQLIDRSIGNNSFPTYNMNPAWSKMWNLDFLRSNNLFYNPNVVKGEGTLFTFTASYYMNKVKIIPKPIYGYRINPTSIMHRFSQNILEYNNIQMNSYFNIVNENGEGNDQFIRMALLKRGKYLIENAVQLSISHKNCNWERNQCIEWAQKMCAMPWVQDTANYVMSLNANEDLLYRLIIQQKYSDIVRYCSRLKKRNQLHAFLQTSPLGKRIVEINRIIKNRIRK